MSAQTRRRFDVASEHRFGVRDDMHTACLEARAQAARSTPGLMPVADLLRSPTQGEPMSQHLRRVSVPAGERRFAHRWARVVTFLSALLMLLAVGVVGAPSTASAQTPYCGIYWGSLPKVSTHSSTSILTGVRSGRHDCYDRLVLDLRG